MSTRNGRDNDRTPDAQSQASLLKSGNAPNSKLQTCCHSRQAVICIIHQGFRLNHTPLSLSRIVQERLRMSDSGQEVHIELSDLRLNLALNLFRICTAM